VLGEARRRCYAVIVSTPLDFLYLFRDLLRDHGIRFAITSGMACVRHGIQQSTKDSDWIVAPEDVAGLVALLESTERRFPPWRVRYRNIFGAPLTRQYLVGGWTSHILIHDSPADPAHALDWFGRPPRVREWDADEEGFATRQVVARMKHTDRPKDWPIVDSLGWLMRNDEPLAALLNVQQPPLLRALWSRADNALRARALARRPLLSKLDEVADDDRLLAWLRLERAVWSCVNEQRQRLYQSAWKEFFREWRREEDWDWPTEEPFADQHARVLDAVVRHRLPPDPLAARGLVAVWQAGLEVATVREDTTTEKLLAVAPPMDEVIPPIDG
jgi:hypothetical protein